MNRRKLLKSLFGISVAGGTTYTGWTSYAMFKNPDLSILDLNRSLINDIAETIIPKTDSPGAKDAEVYKYIILILKECTSRQNQNNFINGLIKLKNYTHSQYQCTFSECSKDQQNNIIHYFEQQTTKLKGIAKKIHKKIFGLSFFEIIKKLTIEGFFTSEIGCTQVLAYNPTPGEYITCQPLKPNQKSWASR
ncbi:gluconate 2-dehydrogenase subunit 3 family protein [Aureispira]|nr:gluconate 2-dehydrogenase subunit 3 family protein [Aureispira sp.]